MHCFNKQLSGHWTLSNVSCLETFILFSVLCPYIFWTCRIFIYKSVILEPELKLHLKSLGTYPSFLFIYFYFLHLFNSLLLSHMNTDTATSMCVLFLYICCIFSCRCFSSIFIFSGVVAAGAFRYIMLCLLGMLCIDNKMDIRSLKTNKKMF